MVQKSGINHKGIKISKHVYAPDYNSQRSNIIITGENVEVEKYFSNISSNISGNENYVMIAKEKDTIQMSDKGKEICDMRIDGNLRYDIFYKAAWMSMENCRDIASIIEPKNNMVKDAIATILYNFAIITGEDTEQLLNHINKIKEYDSLDTENMHFDQLKQITPKELYVNDIYRLHKIDRISACNKIIDLFNGYTYQKFYDRVLFSSDQKKTILYFCSDFNEKIGNDSIYAKLIIYALYLMYNKYCIHNSTLSEIMSSITPDYDVQKIKKLRFIIPDLKQYHFLYNLFLSNSKYCTYLCGIDTTKYSESIIPISPSYIVSLSIENAKSVLDDISAQNYEKMIKKIKGKNVLIVDRINYDIFIDRL